MNIKTLHSIDTEYSADTVEWCPYPNNQQYFLCGTYHLEENKGKDLAQPARRKGRIYLYKYDVVRNELERIDVQETAAILDQKWSKRIGNDDPIIGAANALGEVLLYQLTDSKLISLGSVHLDAEQDNLLTLALDWNSDKDADRKMVASDSKGNVSLLQLTEASLEMSCTWAAHSFEAWTCCFNKWNTNIIYSGGDDMCLHVFDTRLDEKKTLTNKSHRAGVTTLLSFPDNEHMLATGSYDEVLRIFDTRQFKNPLSEVLLNGGIWRIKQNPLQQQLLLCACMYHNFSIVEMTEEMKEMSIVGEYFEHKSICYGADWCYEPTADTSNIMTTCSFYDQKLCISTVKME